MFEQGTNRIILEEYYQKIAFKQVQNTVGRSNPLKKQNSSMKKFLAHLDQQHNSEDEGIEDYKIGGYHPVHIGEVLLKRYVVIQKLGWGHFSTVWLCKDFKHETYVAVKIQKSSPHYMEAALDEVEILQKVEMHYNDKNWEGSSRDQTHVVGLLNAFIHKSYYGNHFCMVFEILRCNLLDILKRYDYEGVPLDICQEISKQLLKGLDYLDRICGIIHTDLKPENVMVCLTNEELKQIVENGQLKNNELFSERTKLIQQYMGISNDEGQNIKVQQLKKKLQNEDLTKNQKKNLKKKIKKYSQKQDNEENIQNKHKNEGKVTNFEDLFDLKKGKLELNRGDKLKLPIKVKIADLGNACWKHHHFSTEIQTRQYRSPEVILGQSYNETADIWSFGCMMYEMVTGDLLFQPRKNVQWGKNEDHLAQMQELLGKFDINFLARSSRSKKYFLKNGQMKKFPELNHYALQTVLELKNRIKKQHAKQFANFLLPTLTAEPQKRANAKQMLKHGWLTQKLPHQNFKMNQKEHKALKFKFSTNQADFRINPTKMMHSEASCEDNDRDQEVEGKQGRKKYKYADIRLVDRSFTDLGYVGYCEGIDLDKLDAVKNWQFN